MSELKGILTERETLIGTLSLGADYFKGETGDSGVYVGETTPTDEEINIWIEPTAEVDTLITEELLESKGYMNEAQVRALVEEILKEG